MLSHSNFYLFGVHVVKVVLYKLHTGSKVSLVKLVGDVPAEGPKLSSLLHHCV